MQPIDRVCRECSCNLIPDVNYNINNLKYRIYLCSQCASSKIKRYQKETNYNSIKNLNSRQICLNILGNDCACCKENIWQFLTLDHINNDGYLDKRNKKVITITSFYRFINKEDILRFQILCMNCNYSKGHNGFCSHKVLTNNNLNKCIHCNIELNDKNQINVCKEYKYSLCNNCLLSKSILRNNTVNLSKKLAKRKQTLIIKDKIIKAYGGKCNCCGNSELLSLTIDHINGGGRKEYEQLKNKGSDFYKYLIKNNFPKDNYQLLCYNCNCCKSAFGKCYHQLIKELNVSSLNIEEYKALLLHNKVGKNVK